MGVAVRVVLNIAEELQKVGHLMSRTIDPVEYITCRDLFLYRNREEKAERI